MSSPIDWSASMSLRYVSLAFQEAIDAKVLVIKIMSKMSKLLERGGAYARQSDQSPMVYALLGDRR